jgi:hypothetical protein
MLTISDTQCAHTCAGYSRRDFLRVGGLGLGGLTLSGMLRARAELPPSLRNTIRGRSVVFLFLNGGPSHIESFDPKMDAPKEVRSIFGEVKTKLPGVTFGAHFPQLAARADRISVVRSYGSGNSGHTYQKVASGDNPTKATMSAIYSRIAGANDSRSGLPNNVLVLPEAVQPDLTLAKNFETDALPSLTHSGDLGSGHAAFDPQGGGELKQNMELNLTAERFADRRSLLEGLDRLKGYADKGGLGAMDEYRQQAFDIVTGGVSDAFDLAKEDPRVIAKYDTSKLFDIKEVTRWHDMSRASNQLGKQLLLARRLCEAGCGFVTVSDCGWDHHSNNNSPKGLGGFALLAPQVDHAVSAFIDDVRERGLEDKILLVVTGEMGRTPRINKNGGRDHYGELTPLLFFGGGLKMGQVIGESDSHATRAITTPYRPEHMMATMMRSLFDIGELRLAQGLPGELMRAITEGKPIRELVS